MSKVFPVTTTVSMTEADGTWHPSVPVTEGHLALLEGPASLDYDTVFSLIDENECVTVRRDQHESMWQYQLSWDAEGASIFLWHYIAFGGTAPEYDEVVGYWNMDVRDGAFVPLLRT